MLTDRHCVRFLGGEGGRKLELEELNEGRREGSVTFREQFSQTREGGREGAMYRLNNRRSGGERWNGGLYYLKGAME